MKFDKRSFAVVLVLFAAASLGAGPLKARDADPTPRNAAMVQAAKQKCINVCRARYRACRSLRQIPTFECTSVYQDCARWTCNGLVD